MSWKARVKEYVMKEECQVIDMEVGGGNVWAILLPEWNHHIG